MVLLAGFLFFLFILIASISMIWPDLPICLGGHETRRFHVVNNAVAAIYF